MVREGKHANLGMSSSLYKASNTVGGFTRYNLI